MFFSHLLVPLGRFWVPFWTQLDSKGVPKIMFLGIMLEKWRKKGVRKRDPKKHQNLIEIWSRNERVWEVKMSVSLGNCCKIAMFGVSWNIEKIGAKRDPKNDQNLSQKRSEIRRFLGGEILRIRNLDVFWERKKWTKNLKKSENWGSEVKKVILWDWPGRVCGRGWCFGVCQFSIPIWHASSPERGRRIQSLTRIPPCFGSVCTGVYELCLRLWPYVSC